MRILGLIFGLGLAGVSNFAKAGHTGPYRQYVTDDFYLETRAHSSSISTQIVLGTDTGQTGISCRDQIKKILCLVAPRNPKHKEQGRPCESGGEKYASTFEALYDAYPPVLQKMFCSLKVINIEKQFFGTAYAGLVKDPTGKVIGAEMGIRQSVLDESLDLSTWATWKEQLSFGGVKDSYTVTPGLPIIETHSQVKGVSDFLYFVVAHEFGHMLDFSNNLNQTRNCTQPSEREGQKCELASGSWGELSWLMTDQPKPENQFSHREELCFYGCESKFIGVSDMDELYRQLYATDFISTYAAIQPWDDFADSLAYFVMNRFLNTSYIIHTSKSQRFDIMNKVRSERWSKKYRYLDQLLNKTDLIYP